jgi:shikimate kinase
VTAEQGTGPRVVLVGAMGAGKSTVARLLAEKWSVAARDSDADVEAAAGSSVQDLFVQHGEQHFRRLERDAVRRALAEHDGVLALGGGAVLSEETRELLRGHTVVFLDVDLADAVRRVGLGAGRPLLLGNVRGTLRTLLAERRPVYLSVATHRVDTSGRTPQQVADDVLTLVEGPAR